MNQILDVSLDEKDINPAFFEYKKASHRLLGDLNGEPLTVYHATSHQFEMFYPLSHFGTKIAAQTRIKNFSETKHLAFSMFENAGSEKNLSYALNMLLSYVKKIKEKKASSQYEYTPYIIPAHLAISNPKRMIEMGFYRSGYKDDLLYRLIQSDLLQGLYHYRHKTKPIQKNNALYQVLDTMTVPVMYDFIFKDPFNISAQQVRYELGLETLYPILGANNSNNPYNGLKDAHPEHSLLNNMFVNRANLSMQRMIRYWENLGYDGFIYDDTVDNRNKAFSYVIFRPLQVVRLDRDPVFMKGALYPTVSNQKKLDDIRDKTLSQMTPRRLTKSEKSRMTAWHFEAQHFYLKERD